MIWLVFGGGFSYDVRSAQNATSTASRRVALQTTANYTESATASNPGLVTFEEALASIGLGAVPEPASVMMLCVGVGMLTLRRNRCV